MATPLDTPLETILDARILCLVSSLIAGDDKEQLLTVLGTFGTLLGTHKHKQFKYSTISNVTGLLLLYTSPLTILIQEITEMVQQLYDTHGSEDSGAGDEESSDVEEFANWIAGKSDAKHLFPADESVISMASLLVLDLELKGGALGFSFADMPFESMVFQVLKCKLRINSVYMDDITLDSGVSRMVGNHEAFNSWFKGFYGPYKYYWDNYGSLTSKEVIRFHQLCQFDSTAEIFEGLIAPIKITDSSDKLESGNWLQKVILPILCWNQFDFSALYNWLTDDDKMNHWKSSKNQRLWKSVMSSFIQLEVPFEKFDFIVEGYLKLCYYEATKEKLSEKSTSLEMLQAFDLIKDTCTLLIPIVPKSGSNVFEGNINYDLDESFELFTEFSKSTSLGPLLQPNKDCLILLSEMIETCSSLYPINQTTVSRFLELKYSKLSTVDDLKRESSKILVGLRPTNASQLLKSLELFKSTFASNDTDIELIDNLVIDRLLFNNLFSFIEELYDGGKLTITDEEFLQLILKKFWESVNNSNGFDERLGKMKDATDCILLLNKVTSAGNISAESKSSITKLKHILKVFSNIKNFKIVLDRSSVCTPKEIIRRFGSLPSNEELRTEMESSSPMGLITIILTHNPKSYVAFEKLFKILNDFLIFLDDKNPDSSYYFQRLMAACIEASLLDNNFVYAHRKSVELLDQYSNAKDHNLNNMWMTFYQVGNYHSPDWHNNQELDSNKIDVLQKQSEILSKYLLIINRTDITIDNSRIIVDKWVQTNNSIEEWYDKMEHLQQERSSNTSSKDLQENVTATANEILNDAANTTNQASEKLSNLLVSGLGWAIGANK